MTWKTGALHPTCDQRRQSSPFPFNKITQNSRPLAWSNGMLKLTSKFWLVSQKLSAPRSRGSKEEAVYNSVSSETLSMTGNKGLKRSSWFPHRVCFLIHRNITGPNSHKETWLLCFCTDSRAGIPLILIPKQTPLFMHPIGKLVASSSPSRGSQTKAGHAAKLFRDYTLSPLISKMRIWRGLTQVPTGNGRQEPPSLAPPAMFLLSSTPWFLGSVRKSLSITTQHLRQIHEVSWSTFTRVK